MRVAAAPRSGSGGRSGLRQLLLGSLLAVAVIVALLNWCTLNAHGASVTHDSTVAASVAGHAHAEHLGPQEAPAAANDSHPAHAVVAACAMVLLAILGLLAVPPHTRRPGGNRLGSAPHAQPRGVFNRPAPSLLVLCISRT